MDALQKWAETKWDNQEVTFNRGPAVSSSTGDDPTRSQTEVTKNTPKATRFAAHQFTHADPELAVQAQRRQVDAVVTSILEDGILFTCRIADGATKTIKLPIGLVPEPLRQYAQPVRVSLRIQNGIRTPYVEARDVPVAEDDEFSAGFKAWMQTR